MKKFKSFSVLAGVLILLPLLTNAQSGITPVQPPSAVDIPSLVASILGFLFGLLLVIAALFIIWAAYLYLTAAGNEENVGKAKNYIIYAVISIVIAFLARAIVFVVRNILGT